MTHKNVYDIIMGQLTPKHQSDTINIHSLEKSCTDFLDKSKQHLDGDEYFLYVVCIKTLLESIKKEGNKYEHKA